MGKLEGFIYSILDKEFSIESKSDLVGKFWS